MLIQRSYKCCFSNTVFTISTYQLRKAKRPNLARELRILSKFSITFEKFIHESIQFLGDYRCVYRQRIIRHGIPETVLELKRNLHGRIYHSNKRMENQVLLSLFGDETNLYLGGIVVAPARHHKAGLLRLLPCKYYTVRCLELR